MGWDAHSSAEFDYEKGQFVNTAHQEAFLLAVHEVKTLTGTYDGYLKQGGLDCSDSCKMLELATGESCYAKDAWSAEKVKELNDKADWRIYYGGIDAWAYWSARKFLETCAELSLSITFSW